MILQRRRFTFVDQQRFASASGDHNPMHVDALYARRTQAGAPVVHGVHLLLWSLNALAAERPELPDIQGIRAQFKSFVYLDEEVQITLTRYDEAGARLEVISGGASRARMTLIFGEPAGQLPEWVHTASFEPVLAAPAEPDPTQLAEYSAKLPFVMTIEDAINLFPALARRLGPHRVAALAASTYLVGMVCPGRHSIFNGLSVTAVTEGTDAASLAFRVTDVDPRYHTIEQEIAGGGWLGTVSSVFRLPPVQQASSQSMAGIVEASEFAGSIALVIGGSRGLGELTAKILAAGGARVLLTWHTGQSDAEQVAAEIRAAGGRCEAFQYDALAPAAEQLQSFPDSPTHAYYFATPAIFLPQQSSLFDGKQFQKFAATYVNGFWNLAAALQSRQRDVSLFYPSSVFVSNRPSGFVEYAMAKSAGEVLCAEINVALAPMHVTVSRLPRLATDQTASVTAREMVAPLDTMLPLIREVQSWPR